jgi:cardiolipin synthase
MTALTTANQLTLFRLFAVPCVVILVLYGFDGWALVTFAAAGITDALDGVIARRSGQPTSLGAFLDPMADKLLLVSTFVVLTMERDPPMANVLPIWLTVLVISRDIVIVLTVAVVNLAIGRREFHPSALGKVATLLYVLTCAFALLFNYLGRPSVVVDIMVYTALAVTVASGLHYILHVARLVNEA